ncbi:PduM family microcompartment protein [Vagococcus carniphilus]|uniref:PduM family microcompartment protein n=1 Tax=Vagococcus carniphilus TaxID=218144 RepID=UPI003B5A2371
MNEDKLISMIKEKLVEREKKQVAIAYQHNCQIALPPSVTVFYEYRNINLHQVSIRLIKDLYQMKETPWVEWLLTGISYQILFSLELNEFILPFVPWKMLTEWPVVFKMSNQRVYAFQTNMLTRQLIIGLPNNSFLVILKQQKLTQEAIELIKKNNITVIERVNETCIWEES